ncbi:thioesterase superfamily protein [Pirellula staleyi DSM 6068]|uniref:Thioesterase superfamily protein n=1 Tax=Pirellula staleyi (strain ATCC 27377 / DSM 6068 / ICPB 4128) TaxID=530564 RepID=D2QYU8_PIRSD|nr:thioesterase family protein [Pirellula staleyi]ADB16403.1 thioesterase superfamily protein [Pirellula staleyi DSM 6068]
MSTPLRVERRVEFCDTDAAGIMHFSAYFRFMEQAEHELLRACGLSVMSRDEEGKISWPRVAAKCNYSAAAKFEDTLSIDVSIIRIGEKSLTYRFLFFAAGRPLAEGEMTSVCCRIVEDQPPRSIPIPTWFAEKLRPFLVPPAT